MYDQFSWKGIMQDIVMICGNQSTENESLPDTPKLIPTPANDQSSSLPRAFYQPHTLHHIRAVGALPGHGAIELSTQSASAAWFALIVVSGSSLTCLDSDPVLGSRALGDPT
jgi:hypothetical protein